MSKTRFLIISDTHTQPLFKPEDTTHAFRRPLPKADVLLHCGDLTMLGGLEEYRAALNMLASVDAELKLVIAGNHDRSLDGKFWAQKRYSSEPEELHAKAVRMWKGEVAKKTGVTYLDEGLYSFTLKSGATFKVYASPYQPEFCRWAFPYERWEDRFNSRTQTTPPDRRGEYVNICENPIPSFPGVDIIMTHGPPLHHLDRTLRNQDVGCPHLLQALKRARPKLYCFGHIHEGWGAELLSWKVNDADEVASIAKVDKLKPNMDDVLRQRAAYVDASSQSQKGRTLLVNAAIMTADYPYKPNQAPWLVDLDLGP